MALYNPKLIMYSLVTGHETYLHGLTYSSIQFNRLRNMEVFFSLNLWCKVLRYDFNNTDKVFIEIYYTRPQHILFNKIHSITFKFVKYLSKIIQYTTGGLTLTGLIRDPQVNVSEVYPSWTLYWTTLYANTFLFYMKWLS